MPISGETLYSQSTSQPDILQAGRDNDIAFSLIYQGENVALSSAKVTLFGRDSTDAVITDATATIVADEARYTIAAASIPSTEIAKLGNGWLEVWKVVVDGETKERVVNRPAILALRPPAPSVTDATLLAEHPDLIAYTNNGTTTLQSWISTTWGDIIRRWEREGGALWSLVDPHVFHEAHRELTLHKIFRNAAKTLGNEALTAISDGHKGQYDVLWRQIVARYDRDGDGRADDPDNVEAHLGLIHFTVNRSRGAACKPMRRRLRPVRV